VSGPPVSSRQSLFRTTFLRGPYRVLLSWRREDMRPSQSDSQNYLPAY
jgi:hypothetical protein